jgi:transcriptional regulator with XRE-family HTH domain
MKSGIKQIDAKHAQSDTLIKPEERSLSSLSAHTKKTSTTRPTSLNQPTRESRDLNKDVPQQYLLKSMEKTFRRMVNSRTARDAYVRAEVTTALAHQIRAIRLQRGLSQHELAKKIKTTQTAISRLENPSYGRISLKTLLDLSFAFDTGLDVRFVSLVSMIKNTFIPKIGSREVFSFDDECSLVEFYSSSYSIGEPVKTLPCCQTLSVSYIDNLDNLTSQNIQITYPLIMMEEIL